MSKGLGRGLSSLIPPKQNTFSVQAEIQASEPALQQASQLSIRELPLSEITPNPLQPRQHFDEKNLEQLTESIRMYGLLEPIVVTEINGQWTIVAGERRFRAFTQLGRKTIPAIIRSTSELERLELALIENIQREDLNPMEKAEALAKLLDDFGLTQEEASKKIGMARSTLANILRLRDLSTEIQQGLAQRRITEGHAKVLLGIRDPQQQTEMYQRMLQGSGMSVEELRTVTKKISSKKHRLVDYEIQQMEDRLQSALGTKVLVQKRQGKTSITIYTYSSEELKNVLKKITSS